MEWVGENEQLKRTKERKVILSESEFRAEAALPPIIIASHGRGRLAPSPLLSMSELLMTALV